MVSTQNLQAGERHPETVTEAERHCAEDDWRANTYGLLAAFLAAPPSADLLQLLQVIGDGDEAGGAMIEAWRMLKLAGREARPEALDGEYHALFIGLGQGELMPYGSWYMTGSLMDRPLVYLRRDLDQLGIARREDIHEPEDHAAALCEAMRVMIQAPDIPWDWQRRFFREHLAPWMTLFFQDLQQARAACFYTAVGRLGEAFMDLENRYLDMPA